MTAPLDRDRRVRRRRRLAARPRLVRLAPSLCADLEAAYPREARLASFGFTQGDEIQGLLAPDADPFLAVLRGALRPDARKLRWAFVAGEVEPGSGPATERTGRRSSSRASRSVARACTATASSP